MLSCCYYNLFGDWVGEIMAKRMVEYEVDDDGNCAECQSCFSSVCLSFKKGIIKNNCIYTQCQSCKDFLAKEASKVYCDGCKKYPDNCRL